MRPEKFVILLAIMGHCIGGYILIFLGHFMNAYYHMILGGILVIIGYLLILLGEVRKDEV